MDVDIDLQTSFDPLEYFDTSIRASMVKGGKIQNHPAGVYFQYIPQDKITKLAAIPYKQAEDFGYVKFDFLHLSILDYFDNKQQIRKLLEKEPDWNLLLSAEVVQKLFQIHRHYKVVSAVRPNSVEQLADTIALIRPSKRELLNQYVAAKQNGDDLTQIRQQLYQKPTDDKYYFKKGHSLSYAFTIVLQLHLIEGEIL